MRLWAVTLQQHCSGDSSSLNRKHMQRNVEAAASHAQVQRWHAASPHVLSLTRQPTGVTITLDEDSSVRVLSVSASGPVAASKSVQAGDIVTQVNGGRSSFCVTRDLACWRLLRCSS